MSRNKKLKAFELVDSLGLVIFSSMVIVSYLRIFISVGLVGAQDEMHWVASAYSSSIGGTPFVNDLYIQQLCGLIYEPFVFVYHKLFGNTGILLFVRHLYFLLTLFSAAIFFRYARQRASLVCALACASIPIVATMWGQPSLGYNALGGLFFGLGSLWAAQSLESANNRLALASGFCFFIALAAYPTLLGSLLVLWLCLSVAALILKRPFIKRALIANSATVLLLTVFLGLLVARSSWANIRFAYDFSTAQSSMGSLTAKLLYGFTLLVGFLPPWYFVLSAFAVWFLAWRKFGLNWLWFAAPMCIWTGIKDPPEPGPFYPPLLLMLALSGSALVIRAAMKDFKAHWKESVLWLVAFVSAIFPWWSSALTLYVTFVTANYCITPLLILTDHRKKLASSLLVFVIPLTAFFHKVVLNQTDDGVAIQELVLLTDGPYAGLWTSPKRAEFLQQLSIDVNQSRTDTYANSILFYDEFPLGYLMADLYPATPALFMHGLRESFAVRPFFKQYYSAPQNQPDLIVRFNKFPYGSDYHSVHPDQFKPYEDVFWDFLPSQSNLYRLIKERSEYSIFAKNKSQNH